VLSHVFPPVAPASSSAGQIGKTGAFHRIGHLSDLGVGVSALINSLDLQFITPLLLDHVGPLGIPKTIKNTINSHHIPHYGKKKRNVHAPLKTVLGISGPSLLM
jgi:hypothetical protein